jgi:hypothetical protein
MSRLLKAASLSVIHLIAAAAVYDYLITGGWLTAHYSLDDSNIVNLILAIFEPIAILSVIAYWIWRTPFLYRLLVILGLAQLLIGTGFALFILVFMLTWHAKMI